MKKILEYKVIRALLLFLLNFSITATLVFVGVDHVIKTREEAKKIKLITGVIHIGAMIEEFDEYAKELSSGEGGQTITNSTSETSNSNTSGSQISSAQSSSNTFTPNYAALTGLNLRLSEGDSFNPLVDLKIKATDRDGADITNKVKVINNNVNMNQSGYYSVVANVKLQDNTELMQTFFVEVIAKPLRVNVTNVSLIQNEVELSKPVSVKFDVISSKATVTPISANVNGIDYPIIKDSTKECLIEFMAPNESKVETIVLNSIQMSDGTTIAVNHKMKLSVLKQMPIVQKLSQIVNTSNGKMAIKLQVSDVDSALETGKPITAILYDENYQELKRTDIYSINQSNNVFNVPRNGKYYLRVFGFINRNHTSTYEWTQIYEEELVIDNIDKTTLEGKNISIQEGSDFDAIKDLQLTATNENGEDITSQIFIEGDVNTKIPGTYEVIASLLKSDGQIVQKIFKVTVQAVKTQVVVERFETQQSIITPGTDVTLDLVVTLSKDYVEVERIVLDGKEYPVEKLETDIDSNQKTYQVLMEAPQASGGYEFELSKLILSNGEELLVNEKVTLTLTKMLMYHEPLAIMSDEAELVNPSLYSQSTFSTRDNQTVTGPHTQSHTSKLEITGQVNSSDGAVPSGQISVTLPTAVGFVVDQDGNLLVSSSMSIANNSSSVDISVYVASFTDTTPDVGKGITVVDSRDLTDKDRSFVSLSLVPNGGVNPTTVHLSSTGITGSKLVDISANSQVGLTLTGQAGKNKYTTVMDGNKNQIDVDNQGVSDQFTLVFKITKN